LAITCFRHPEVLGRRPSLEGRRPQRLGRHPSRPTLRAGTSG
jgi:hypothetical protein